MPTGYPGVVSAATPANPLAGLALPQPTSTGSLDLSNIKPTNTGNVSLADAIAKARTSAGVRPERYSQRRSRSRSPRREGGQPEGYNPFRDERRSEVRRASPGRGRSATPPRGAYAGASFPLGAAPETAGESTEVIVVEKSSVGLIIGRNGENLKRVEAEFGARVQFMADTGETTRKCKITGTPQQRADAITDIFRTAQENPKRNQQAQAVNSNGDPPLREGERSVQIMVPDKTVGLIIGRRGETIQDLQERSGCHINILGENKSERGLRPVNLIGTYEASEKAKQLIMEVVESDTRIGQQQQQGLPPIPPVSHSPYGPPPTGYNPYGPPMPQYGQPPAPAYGQPPQDQKTEEKIFVPSEAVGMIIGKGGETIKAMQASHGCKINVSQPQGSDIQREIGLIGTTSAKEGAKRDIWDKVNTVVSPEFLTRRL
jgi:far upstream element-binding protein